MIRMHLKNNIFFVLIFLTAGLLISSPLSSQETRFGIPGIDYFSRRVYDGATQNWKICQSHHDMLYFANNDGMLEYDGVSWSIYKDMGSFVIRSVKSIGQRIYAGTYNELGYFSYDDNYHLCYTSLASEEQLKQYGDYWNIHEWNDKIVFHSEEALCFFRDDSLSFTIPALSRFTSSYFINGLLLVHDELSGLMEVRGENVYPVAGGNILKGKLITSVIPLSENRIVIGTMKAGLYLWDMQSIRQWDVPSNEILKKANIYCGTDYEDRYMVFGTIQSGMIVTDKAGRIVFQIDKDKGLNNNTVLSLFVDRDGNIWGGLDNGIVKINLRSGISFLQGYYDLGTGYVTGRNYGKWYFGTNQGLFSIRDEYFSNPLKDRDDFKKIEGTDGQVWSLFNTDDSFLCGHNLGVFEVDEHGAELITPSTINGAWIFREVPGREDLIIAGTYDGLILLEKIEDGWQFKSIIDGFKESSRYIEWGPEGNLWISHGYKGVFSLSFEDGYTRVAGVDAFSMEEFPDIGPSFVISKIDGQLIISGERGLFRVNDSSEIERYRYFDSYFEERYPDRLLQDRYRNIWYFMNGKTGVLRIMEDGTYKNIDFPFIPLENKLVSSFESVFILDRDNIIFGIEDGFAHYSVRDESDFSKPFKVHIRSFKGRPDSLAYVLNQDEKGRIQQTVPEYRFRDNLFEINYAATYFREGKVEYSTYLSDYDLEGGSWSTNTSRQFAKLEEGDYEFVVKARNSFGVQSEPVKFMFTITPPWHRTMAAKITYVFFSLLMIILFIHVFNRRLEINSQKEKLRQQVSYKAREEQLNSEALKVEKELIRMRNERLRSEMVFKEKELANSTMSILQKNESLRDIKSNMVRISKLENNSEIKSQMKRLINRINRDIDSEDYWKVFEVHMEQVHEAFLKRLSEKHPDLTNRERRLCAYIRMGMSSKEIAALVNISFRAVENNRYRLRQKLDLSPGENLSRYISSL